MYEKLQTNEGVVLMIIPEVLASHSVTHPDVSRRGIRGSAFLSASSRIPVAVKEVEPRNGNRWEINLYFELI
jgi:hypothetical protein